LIHDATVAREEKFFASAGRDESTGDLVLKAINHGREAVAAQVSLRGLPSVSPSAQLTVLTSPDLADNNSLAEPRRVVPANTNTTVSGNQFSHDFPPHSLTILRLHR
jgi:alpha-L-arabinofuranosidase